MEDHLPKKTSDPSTRPRVGPSVAAALMTVAVLAGCNHLGRSVYYPAPTPIFMEEGLREEPGGGRSVVPASAAEGVSGLLNPAVAEAAKASHAAAQETGDRRQGTVDRGQELPPPTAPPGPPSPDGLQPAMPEYLPGGPRA